MVLVAEHVGGSRGGGCVQAPGGGVKVGPGVAVGGIMLIFVSFAADASHRPPPFNQTVAHTAVLPPATPVTTVEYGLDLSLVGLTVATAVLYEPKSTPRAGSTVAPPLNTTLAITLEVPPTDKLRLVGFVFTVQLGTGVRVGPGLQFADTVLDLTCPFT